jgi:hypothetical protein
MAVRSLVPTTVHAHMRVSESLISYLSFFLFLMVLIFENRERAGEGEPSHFLFFADGEKPREETRRPSGSTAPRRRPEPRDFGPNGELPDDRVDDLWPYSR